MIPFEQAQQLLSDFADQLPQAIFRGLNGGILLLPEYKLHPQRRQDDLYILGEYHYEPLGFGRYITIYYGSFCRTQGNLPPQVQIDKLREVLYHELTHHLEHLAGDRSLELQDAIDLQRHLDRGPAG